MGLPGLSPQCAQLAAGNWPLANWPLATGRWQLAAACTFLPNPLACAAIPHAQDAHEFLNWLLNEIGEVLEKEERSAQVTGALHLRMVLFAPHSWLTRQSAPLGC